MSSTANPAANLSNCGCCQGVAEETPMQVTNRPGLSAIAYRIGVHSQFRASMLAELSALSRLKARVDDDFSIACLDAWATVADVLTFYQERIANESYLRTATERRSLEEMARLIGYEPRPGVAAVTFLVFTLQSAPGAPTHAAKPSAIAIGTKVQSVPGPGEQPQTFETVEAIEGRIEWNAVQPRLTSTQVPDATTTSVTLAGTANNVKPGDRVLIVAGSGPTRTTLVRTVANSVIDTKAATTRLDLALDTTPLIALVPPPAPSPIGLLPLGPVTGNTIATIVSATWRQADLLAVATAQNWSIADLETNIRAQAGQPALATGAGIFALRQRANIFGSTAPKWDSLPGGLRNGDHVPQFDAQGHLLLDPPNNPQGAPVYKFIPPVYPVSWEGTTLAGDVGGPNSQVDLDAPYPAIVAGSWLVLEGGAATPRAYSVVDNAVVYRTDFSISGKVSRLTLAGNDGFDQFTLRETTARGQSVALAVSNVPITDPVGGTTVVVDGPYLGLRAGQHVCLTGMRTDLSGVTASEFATIADVLLVSGFTTIIFEQALTYTYVRNSVTINANVALASHGETVREVLGDGNGQQDYQHFTLRQTPLTYTAAATPTGAASTLQVRVNDLLWQEVPALYGTNPTDRVYITNRSSDGKTTVEFGNGINGAHLPTGQQNVAATYRKGSGTAGNLKAGQLSLLMTRPLGVKTAINPLAPTGGVDPESSDAIAINAPIAVRALDRIVSLQDYEDFARAFAGVSKALATFTWNDHARGVVLTVAGPGGSEVTPDSATFSNLLSAMQQASHAFVPIRVQSYRKAFFRIAATITIDPTFDMDEVMSAVEQELRSRFSFDVRTFGQGVALSEVMAAVQSVAGVVAVNIRQLVRTDGIGGDGRLAPLPAAFPQPIATATAGAELLSLDPAPLEVVGILP